MATRRANGAAGGNDLNVAVLQMNSGDDKQRNIESALALIDSAAAAGARLAVLPEIWPYLGPDEGNRANAEPIPGPVTDLLAERARRHALYIHAGSILESRRGEPGLFNISSNVARSAREVIAALSSVAGVAVDHQVDPARVRANEVIEVRGSYDALHAATGWEPEIPFEQTLADTLAWWNLNGV